MNTTERNCLLSVVSPVYMAERIVDELVQRIKSVLSTITENYEIILVEDGGVDNSWQKIVENCEKDNRIKGIKLSRNFGQHHAITAGLDYCSGEWVVVMDCDLQDIPEEISKLYHEALKGFDIVFARRHQRVDSFLKKLTNILFYKVFTYLSGIKQDRTISNFGIFNKRVIQEINKIREPMRGFSQMARWVGFQKSYVDVTHGQRFEGKSTYSFAKLINLGLDIAIAYTDKPLRIVVNIGILVSCFSLFFVIYCFIAYFSGWLTVPGYASIIASIWLLSGLIILMLGVVGIYIGKIFEGVKNRPLYIIEKASNLNR